MGLQDETRARVWLAAISPLPKNWKFSGTPMTVAESSVNVAANTLMRILRDLQKIQARATAQCRW